jgi:dihydrofolate synthase/folylpolyglutamate synthase
MASHDTIQELSVQRNFRRYEDALAYILEAIDLEKTAKYKYDVATFDLDRVRRIVAHMGDPHAGMKMAHIAGTKGKGSTATVLADILSAHGLRTGLFTSPHLVDLRERIVIDGEMAPKPAMLALVNRLAPYVERERLRDKLDSPTFFEILTALGFAYFKDERVDCAVIEVGLGGRLDSTNVITPLVSVITTVDFDHTDKLGNTLAQIAGEKAGIIKPGVPVVVSPQRDEAMGVIAARAREVGAPLIALGVDAGAPSCAGIKPAKEIGRRGVRFSMRGTRGRYVDLFLGLLGEHQAVNAAVAIVAAEIMAEKGLFALKEDALRGALASARVPGRVEVISEKPVTVLDSAHNPVSARALRKTLEEYFTWRRLVLLIGMVKDKDIAGFLREIAPMAGVAVTTQVDNPRAADADSLRQAVKEVGFAGEVEAIPDPVAALRRAQALTGPQDLLCITGSFYLAGKMKELHEGTR